ncbi:IS110 family transposase, partial [Salmonella enterica]|uniref:IS110 family transposase n=2 Tax=Pseudomonadati TaxID=3379134 RepID=UPI0020C35DCF
MLLVYLLSKAGFTVSMENPLKIKNFARVMLSVVKTDEIDARLIALYGERMQPAPFKLRSDSLLLLKQKRTVLRQLKKQL